MTTPLENKLIFQTKWAEMTTLTVELHTAFDFKWLRMATKEDKQTGLISNTLNKASEKLVKSDNEKRLKVSTCSANIGRTKYEKKKNVRVQ